MLTRLEVDGFKNLLGFSADFGLFNCVAGPNAVGKSNLFDAIEFLSLLADMPVKDAVRKIRGEGEVRDLFWTDGDSRLDRMRFAVEMLTESVVTDERKKTAGPIVNFFRYELELGLVPSELASGPARLAVTQEWLQTNLWSVKDSIQCPNAMTLRDKFLVAGDDSGLGANRYFRQSGSAMARTSISTIDTIGDDEGSRGNKHELALRREMQSWRRLALEPAELRRPDSHDDLDEAVTITTEGAHLPAMIYRLAHQPVVVDEPDPQAFYASLTSRLSALISVRMLGVDYDQKRGRLSLEVEQRGGRALTARGLSDGTLRFLALATLSFDRKQRLLCIEEPENGIHPRRIEALVDLLEELASSTSDLDTETTLRQVIINTHSSELVTEVFRRSRENILLAGTALSAGPEGREARVLRLHPLRDTWRCHDGVRGVMLPVVDYIGAAAGADHRASAAEDGE